MKKILFGLFLISINLTFASNVNLINSIDESLFCQSTVKTKVIRNGVSIANDEKLLHSIIGGMSHNTWNDLDISYESNDYIRNFSKSYSLTHEGNSILLKFKYQTSSDSIVFTKDINIEDAINGVLIERNEFSDQDIIYSYFSNTMSNSNKLKKLKAELRDIRKKLWKTIKREKRLILKDKKKSIKKQIAYIKSIGDTELVKTFSDIFLKCSEYK